MSKLLAYNLTGSPLALAAGNNPVTLPASAAPPARSAGVNVTSELRGLGDYTALQAQFVARDVDFVWDGEPEYDTAGLSVDTPVEAAAPAVSWRPGAPPEKLGGKAFLEFYDAHAECVRLRAMGYRRVVLEINTEFSTDELTYDLAGPNEFQIENVGTVKKRPSETFSSYDMKGIWIRSTFDPSGGFSVVTWEDDTEWFNLHNCDGQRLDFVSSSIVPGTGIRLNGPGWNMQGVRQEMYCSRVDAVPLITVAGFGGFFNTPNHIFTPMVGISGFPALAPVVDIAGAGFSFFEFCHKGMVKDTFTDSVGGGFAVFIDLVGNGLNSWNQAGLDAGGATWIVNTFGPRKRESQPTRNLEVITAADSPYDSTDHWGTTYLVNSVQGPVEILMPTCSPCLGEESEVKDIGGNFLEVAGAASPDGDILYEAPRHDTVTVEHVVAGNNTPFSISVLGTAITVNSATDGGGLATTDAATAAAALNLDAGVIALGVTATAQGTGLGLLATAGAAPLVTSGRAGTNNITLTPKAGEFIEDAVISVDGESRVHRSDGGKDWHRLSI